VHLTSVALFPVAELIVCRVDLAKATASTTTSPLVAAVSPLTVQVAELLAQALLMPLDAELKV
jgi:hypothetical protein